jgi:hypothetical protein
VDGVADPAPPLAARPCGSDAYREGALKRATVGALGGQAGRFAPVRGSRRSHTAGLLPLLSIRIGVVP